jgi:hypothetical protein
MSLADDADGEYDEADLLPFQFDDIEEDADAEFMLVDEGAHHGEDEGFNDADIT